MKRVTTWLFCALLITSISSAGFATQVLGGQAGTAEDSNDATFHFDRNNEDFLMTKPDGTALTNADMPYHYGTTFKILQGNKDLVSIMDLAVIGDLISNADLNNAAFPSAGTVAIDPTTGVFKFSPVSTWSGAVRKDNGSDYNAQPPSIAMNNNGEAWLTFRQNDQFSGNNYIWAKRYTPANGWYNAVSFAAIPGATSPQVIMNDSGRAIVISQTTNAVYANWYIPGTGWYGSVTVQANSGTLSGTPQIDLNGNGQAVLVFNQVTANPTQFNTLYATHFNFNNQYWSVPVQIDNANNTTGAYYSVAINNLGRAAVAFIQNANIGAGDDLRLYVNQYDGSSWGTATRIDNDLNTEADSYPSVAINDYNRIVVAYLHTDSVTRVLAREYNPGTTWYDNVTVSAFDTWQAADPPQVMINNNNQGFCTFMQPVGSYTTIQAARFQSGISGYVGSGWYQAVTISSTVGQNAISPSMDINDNGNAIVSYTVTGSPYTVHYNEYNPYAGGWQSATIYESQVSAKDGDTSNADNSAATINNQGKAMIAMVQAFQNNDQIFVNHYNNSIPSGTLRVNYYEADPTPTATPVTTVNDANVINRKIMPGTTDVSTISYSTTEAGMITIKIYNLKGELVKTLVEAYHQPGDYTTGWAAQNVNGNLVASGIYIVHVKTPNLTKTLKIAVIK